MHRNVLLRVIYLAARYYAAFLLLGYGFAKVMGAQFTVLDSQLARPMGQVSGFWLTWYYFGYSPVYAALVAWTQIGGALLLCFRRAALAGALILLPVAINIVCIDVWVIRFPLSNGALRNALLVLGAVCVVLAYHARDLWRFVFAQHERLRLLPGQARWAVLLPAVAALAMTGYAAHESYWTANFNNRAPTPIDGAWAVVSGGSGASGVPARIFFEYNRRYMAVFESADGQFVTHDFRVDAADHEVILRQTWLRLGAVIFSGVWSRNGDALMLSGKWEGRDVVLHLRRIPMPVRDHA